MMYEFNCEACNRAFEEELPMADCTKPLKLPCPMCGVEGKVFRIYSNMSFQFEMNNDFRKRAGSEWNDMMKEMKKASGRNNYIEHY